MRVAGILLLGLVLVSCGEDAETPEPGPVSQGDLSRAHAGPHDPEEARRLAPKVYLLRTQEGYRCEIETAADRTVSWIRVLNASGSVLHEFRSRSATCLVDPGAVEGLVVRVRYGDGSTWRTTVGR